MKTGHLASLILFSLCMLILNVSFGQRAPRRAPKIPPHKMSKLRAMAQTNAKFRADLMGGSKRANKALSVVLGSQLAKHYRIFVGHKKRQLYNQPSSTNGRVTSSYTIKIPVVVIHEAMAATKTPMQGEAASTFCLAEEVDDGSWACTDEEVMITKGGQIRGRRGAGR